MAIKDTISRINGRVFNRGRHVEWFYAKVLKKPIVLKDAEGVLYEFSPENSFARHINRRGFTDDESVLAYLRRAVRPGDTCLDVGACFGVVTLCMARAVGKDGRVYSFEAERGNYANLSRNIGLNGFSQAKAVNKGVFSDEKGFDLGVCAKEKYGDHSMRAGTGPAGSVQRVETVTLDSFCAREGITRVDALKVDVEGVEPDVLKGAGDLLSRHAIRRIVFEVSERQLANYGYSVQGLIGILLGHGYSIWEIDGDGALRGPMKSYPATNFDNWVALAPGTPA